MGRALTGTVVSDTQDKTVIVRVDRRMSHPLYKKPYLISKKYTAHDEKNEAKLGDVVEIDESRPLSKTKRWTLNKVVNAAEVRE